MTATLPLVGTDSVQRYWRQPSAARTSTSDPPAHQTDRLATEAPVYTTRLHGRLNIHDLHNFNGQTPTKSPREMVRVPSPFRVIPPNGERCDIIAECSFHRDDNYMDMGKTTLRMTHGEEVFCHARSSHV